jgi:hypothetical protein
MVICVPEVLAVRASPPLENWMRYHFVFSSVLMVGKPCAKALVSPISNPIRNRIDFFMDL